jgi:hypothetical protein
MLNDINQMGDLDYNNLELFSKSNEIYNFAK